MRFKCLAALAFKAWMNEVAETLPPSENALYAASVEAFLPSRCSHSFFITSADMDPPLSTTNGSMSVTAESFQLQG